MLFSLLVSCFLVIRFLSCVPFPLPVSVFPYLLFPLCHIPFLFFIACLCLSLILCSLYLCVLSVSFFPCLCQFCYLSMPFAHHDSPFLNPTSLHVLPFPCVSIRFLLLLLACRLLSFPAPSSALISASGVCWPCVVPSTNPPSLCVPGSPRPSRSSSASDNANLASLICPPGSRVQISACVCRPF